MRISRDVVGIHRFVKRGVQPARDNVGDILHELVDFLRRYKQIVPDRIEHLLDELPPLLLVRRMVAQATRGTKETSALA